MTEKRRILLIEDERMMCEMLKAILTGENYEVFVASTAEEGIKQIISLQPDGIVSDINTPGKNNGFDVAEYAMAINTPIVIASSEDPKYFTPRQKALVQGDHSGFIRKGFLVKDFIALVKRVIGPATVEV